MTRQCEASSDKAVDAVDRQDRLFDDISDLIRLADSDAESRTFVEVKVAEAVKGVRDACNAILDSVANTITDIFDAIEDIAT